jgi:hypothetical protein
VEEKKKKKKNNRKLYQVNSWPPQKKTKIKLKNEWLVTLSFVAAEEQFAAKVCREFRQLMNFAQQAQEMSCAQPPVSLLVVVNLI